MSAQRHFRQIDTLPTLSACPLRSDRVRHLEPQRSNATCLTHRSKQRAGCNELFDHLVGAGEQRRWHFDAERLGSDQVDHQIELGRLLDG
jgi:hypothetical protein